jgi:prepilin-type N-terminal cleavage/methylation domain-containing protein
VDKSVQRRCSQRGFSLLEILAALALGVLMMTSLTSMVDATLQDTKGQQTAQYQAQFTAAAQRYLNDNATTLQTSVGSSPGGTFAVNLAALQPKYLPAAFATTNAYRQVPCMLVRNSATPNQLDALIVTEGGDLTGAATIPVKDIGYIAANAGTGGGSIRRLNTDVSTSPIVAQGAYRAWQLDQNALSLFTSVTCSGVSASVGNLASILSYGGPNAINRDVLFRNPAPSDPTLNQMNTPIGMGTGATVTVGTACGGAAIAIDANRNIVSCSSTGFWRAPSSWKEPVANFAALGTVTPAPIDGDVHVTTDKGLAYMYQASTTQWVALAVNDLGDLAVPRNLQVGANISAGNINATTTINAGTDMIAVGKVQGGTLNSLGDVTARNNINATNNITALQNVTGNLVFAKTAVVAQSLSPTLKHFNAGDGCNYFGLDSTGATVTYLAFGSIVSDVAGLAMECRNNGASPASPPGSQGEFVYVATSTTTAPP